MITLALLRSGPTTRRELVMAVALDALAVTWTVWGLSCLLR